MIVRRVAQSSGRFQRSRSTAGLAVVIWAALSALPAAGRAGIFDPADSIFALKLEAIVPAVVVADGGSAGLVMISDDGFGGHQIQAQPSIWNTVNFPSGTSLFTGVPFISNLRVSLHNGSESFASSFVFANPVSAAGAPIFGFGGVGDLTGQMVIELIGGFSIPLPLSPVGQSPPQTQMVPVMGLFNITNTFGPWVTAAVPITGISTNAITLPGRGGASGVAFTLVPTTLEAVNTLTTGGAKVTVCGATCNPLVVGTVSLAGTHGLNSASKPGLVTLVSPIRVDAGAVLGRSPAGALQRLAFIPEPAPMLLLLAGLVALIWGSRLRDSARRRDRISADDPGPTGVQE